MKKAVPLIVVLILAAVLFVVRRCNNNIVNNADLTNKKQESVINRDHGFDRRISYLEYSDHAKCRMDCRKISQSEVEEIMKDGKINYNKSEIKNSRCPRYALEGLTKDDQKVRIVFAQCNEKTVVVTVIDLGTDWTCDCQGDDKKYENKN